jgi:3-oxoacyl-[acyl-carrier protein] reductase
VQFKDCSKPTLLVTGASGGLGQALITHYLETTEFNIIGCSRKKIEQPSDRYLHLEMDLTNPKELPSLNKKILDLAGRIDFLINCIGVSHGKLAYFTSTQDIQDVFSANTFAPFMVIQECSKLMAKKGGGKIINLSSIHVNHATVGTALYGGSKSALEQMTKVLAKELFSKKIYLNTLRLSAVKDTGMTNGLTDEGKQQLVNNTLFKREVFLPEFFGAIDFLISAASNGLCAQEISLGDI